MAAEPFERAHVTGNRADWLQSGNNPPLVPAKAGTEVRDDRLASRLRWNEPGGAWAHVHSLVRVTSTRRLHSNPIGSAGVAEIGVREQCIERHHLADHALLEGVAQHGLKVLSVVGGQTIGPGVAAQ